jgi:queuine tRNA-ribosyltransferase
MVTTHRGNYEVVRTREGAPAMLDRGTGEVMHPIVGPLVEAAALYIGPCRLADRLAVPASEPLLLLDVGLGAGSNAIAAWHVSEGMPSAARRLEIISFDRTLEPMAVALGSEHAGAFGFDVRASAAGHDLLARGQHETPRTRWRVRLADLLDSLGAEPPESADIVFWDPFSPRASPALWSVAAFTALRRLCRAQATVHTYSAATAVRSALLLAGFAVGLGPAAPGRQPQTTVAAVDPTQLAAPLDRRWLDRLARSSAGFASDAPADALAKIGRMPQFGRMAPFG